MAQPLSTMERVNRTNEDMRRLRELVRRVRVKQIVVGLPLRFDGLARLNGRRKRSASRSGYETDWRAGEDGGRKAPSWEAERLLERTPGKIHPGRKI